MQPKRPRFNPLILALALAGVLMIWSVLGTSDSSTGGSTMSYSTVVHYFENNQVTAFTLDRNTSIITLTLKEGKQELPETTGATAATQASGGLLSNLFSSSTSSVGATRNDDGTVTVRYKLPYAYVFIENVQQYIDSYDAANPTAPMEYDYTTLKESIPWMEILFYLGMLGCTGFLLFSMMRGGAGGGHGAGAEDGLAASEKHQSDPDGRRQPHSVGPFRHRLEPVFRTAYPGGCGRARLSVSGGTERLFAGSCVPGHIRPHLPDIMDHAGEERPPQRGAIRFRRAVFKRLQHQSGGFKENQYFLQGLFQRHGDPRQAIAVRRGIKTTPAPKGAGVVLSQLR